MSTPTAFEAECEQCGEVRTFEEFSRERRRMAPGGNIQFDLEFSFRCRACGRREEKLMDQQGVLHKWQGRVHSTFKP